MGYRYYRKQDNFYPVMHWLTSLIAAPLVQYLSFLLFKGTHSPEILAFFWAFFVYGLIGSLPVFVLYYICFRLLAARFETALLLKLVFNTGAIIGAIITFYFLFETVDLYPTLMYAVAIIVCSLFFKPFIKTIEEIPETKKELQSP